MLNKEDALRFVESLFEKEEEINEVKLDLEALNIEGLKEKVEINKLRTDLEDLNLEELKERVEKNPYFLIPDSFLNSEPSFNFGEKEFSPTQWWKRLEKHYFFMKLKTAIDIANICECTLIPAGSIHFKRQEKFGDRKVIIDTRSYLVIKKELLGDLTKAERNSVIGYIKAFERFSM